MTKKEQEIRDELAEKHGHEYFSRFHDIPGPGSKHDQIYCAGYDARDAQAKKEMNTLASLKCSCMNK